MTRFGIPLGCLTLAVGSVLAAAPAQAAVITSPTNYTLVDLGVGNGMGLQSVAPRITANSTTTFLGALTGIYSGSSTNAAPGAGFTSPFGTSSLTNFYAVEPNGVITIVYNAARTSFGALIGTLDSYNNITFSTTGSTATESFTGTQIASALGIAANGSTTKSVLFSGLNSFNTVTLTDSTASAFEIAPLAAVPEPATWAMMVLGMGAVGYAMRRKMRASDAKFDAHIKAITYGAAA